MYICMYIDDKWVQVCMKYVCMYVCHVWHVFEYVYMFVRMYAIRCTYACIIHMYVYVRVHAAHIPKYMHAYTDT